jgi:DDE superfamily endonuclease
LQLLKDFDSPLTEVTVLLLDNFCGHAISDEIEFCFLIVLFYTLNLTAIYLPLDGGIIAAFMLKYLQYLMKFMLQEVQTGRLSFGLITVGKSAEWIK